METLRTTVDEGEGLTIPATLRDALRIKPGDTVVIETHGGELRIRSAQTAALRRLQEFLRPHAPEGRYASDELIAERRAEAERE